MLRTAAALDNPFPMTITLKKAEGTSRPQEDEGAEVGATAAALAGWLAAAMHEQSLSQNGQADC